MKFKLILFFCILAVIRAKFVKRIIAGEHADPVTFNNVVVIYGRKTEGSSLEYIGAGFIYTKNWIIVAGSTSSLIDDIFPRTYVKVYAGKPILSSSAPYEQVRSIIEVHTHPDHHKTLVGRSIDIGLLKLDQSLIVNDHVNVYRISPNMSYPSGIAVVAGWGASNELQIRANTIGNILKVLAVRILSFETCYKSVETVMFVNRIVFSTNSFDNYHFCSGSFNRARGPSLGDNGGPVMQRNENDIYEIIGLISTWPSPTGSVGPVLYIQIPPFLSWIILRTREGQ